MHSRTLSARSTFKLLDYQGGSGSKFWNVELVATFIEVVVEIIEAAVQLIGVVVSL